MDPGTLASGKIGALAEISLTVNGRLHRFTIAPERTLLDVLRRDLGLTGAKNGCDVGICGTCSVLVNGSLKKACIVTAGEANGASITTVEGLGTPHALAPIQQAFLHNTASQCGMCTSGFIVACHHYLERNPSPTNRDAIRSFLRKDFCRCTGYEQIVDAVQEAAGLRGEADRTERLWVTSGGAPPARLVEPAERRERIVGQSVVQYGAVDKVTGRTRFADDVPADPGTVHLTAVRSPHAHARLLSIDPSAALAMGGVVRVITAADIPGGDNYVGMLVRDQRVLVPAGETVKAIGDAVALVCAESIETSRGAASKVRVEYEPLPGVFDPEEALRAGAPVVHPEIESPADPARPNLIHRQHIHKGVASEAEIERLFEEAPSRGLVVVEGDYAAPMQDHAPLEPEIAFARWDSERERVEVFAPVQHVFFARRNIREGLGLPNSRVRVVGTPCGGAYGKREDPYAFPYAALASWLLRRPTRMLWTREETLQYTQKRHSIHAYLKAAVARDGTIVAFRSRSYLDGGAYRSWSREITTKSAVMSSGPYEIENVWIDSHGVYTNNPLTGACRGFGTTNTLFGTELFWSKAARAIGMDPAGFRRLNALRKGSLTSTRHVLHKGVRAVECIDAAREVFGWDRPLERRANGDWVYGRGIASIWYGNGFGRGIRDEGWPIIEITREGRVTVHASTVDYGQGSNTVFQQVTAEGLGIAPEDVTLHTADSDTTPNCGSTVASRVTVVVGKAVEMTARQLREDMLAAAAPLLGASPEELDSADGRIWVREDATRSTTFREVAATLPEPLVRQVPKYNQQFTSALDPDTGEGKAYWPYVFGCHMCTVGVNVKTGQVKVLEYTAAHDIGKVINPQACRGQVIGGAAMGFGYALTEDLKLQNGRVTADNFDTYQLPRSSDLPDMNVVFVEDPELLGDPAFGPSGAKGIGEPPTIAAAPAIVNAINDALRDRGVEITRLPATRGRMLEALGRPAIAPAAESD